MSRQVVLAVAGIIVVGGWALLWSPGYRSVSATPPAGRFTVTGEDSTATVRDNLTSLTWQRGVSMDELDWDQAKSYCQSLGIGGSGWRLPTIKELQTVVDRRQWFPSIDLMIFPETPVDPFWTSTPFVLDEMLVWQVDFMSGEPVFSDLDSTAQARCVR